MLLVFLVIRRLRLRRRRRGADVETNTAAPTGIAWENAHVVTGPDGSVLLAAPVLTTPVGAVECLNAIELQPMSTIAVSVQLLTHDTDVSETPGTPVAVQ